MKLRLRESSVRLRLQRSEVARLTEAGHVTETIRFAPEAALAYSLEVSDEVSCITASFAPSRLRVQLPRALALRWATSEEVTLFREQPVPDGKTLRVLVEKDFACLKPRDAAAWEDESDAFPNPNPSCGGSP